MTSFIVLPPEAFHAFARIRARTDPEPETRRPAKPTAREAADPPPAPVPAPPPTTPLF